MLGGRTFVQRPRRLGLGGNRLQIGLDRRTISGFITDVATFNRPATDTEIFDSITVLLNRIQPLHRRFAWVTLRFSPTLGRDVVYRSVKASRLRSILHFTRAVGDYIDPQFEGSGALGLDIAGEPYSLDRSSFSIVYGPDDAAPPFFLAGDFGKPPHKALDKPFMVTLNAKKSSLELHCFDTACAWLGVPIFSLHRTDPILVPPSYDEGVKYLEAALSAKHGEGPKSLLWKISPWDLKIGRTEIRDIARAYQNAHPSMATPDRFLILGGEVCPALTGDLIFKIRDEHGELSPGGPNVVAIANNHLEVVPMVYDQTVLAWVPVVAYHQELFINAKQELFRIMARRNHSSNGPPTVLKFTDHASDVRTIDVLNAHYETREDEIEARDGAASNVRKLTQLTNTSKLVRVMTSSAVRRIPVRGNILDVAFDYETVYDITGKLIPYAVAYLVLERGELQEDLLTMSTEELLERTQVIIGPECAREFAIVIEQLTLLNQWEKIRLISFNGAKFDAFLFMESVDWFGQFRGGRLTDLFFTNHFFMGGGLVGAQLRAKNMEPEAIAHQWGSEHGTSITTVELFDMAKHLTGMSLAKACKAFNTPHQKIGDFSHVEVQEMYERFAEFPGDLIFMDAWPGFKEKLTEYNKYDVITLAELVCIYEKEIKSLTRIFDDGEDIPLTGGSVCFKHWQHDIETRLLPFAEEFVQGREPWPGPEVCSVFGLWEPMNVEQWTAIRNGIVGGRVEVPNGPQSVDEPVCGLDVCSMYPACMTVYKIMFPCGMIITHPPGRPPTFGRLGVYNIDVDQSILDEQYELPFLVPRKEYSKSGALLRNNWAAPIVNDCWVTTPTIELLMQHGCDITFRGGYEWSHSIRNIDVFRGVLEFLKGKNYQDSLPREQRNMALRSLLKFFANGTYGQTVRGLFERTVQSVTPKQLRKLYEKEEKGEIESINVVSVRGHRVFVDYTRATETLLKKQGPMIVGAFILGHARRTLWQMAAHIPKRFRIVYDTDSVKFHRRFLKTLMWWRSGHKVDHWPELEEIFPGYATCPEIGGTEVGCWQEEVPPNTHLKVAFKKGYVGVAEDGVSVAIADGKPLLSLKGVRRNDVWLPTDVRDMIVTSAKIRYPDRLRMEMEEDMVEMMKTFYQTGQKIGDCAVQFFDALIRDKVAYVVSSSIQRVANNPQRGAGLRDTERHSKHFGSMFQVYRIKKLAIKPPDREEDIVVGQPYDPNEDNNDNTWRRYMARLHRDVPLYNDRDEDTNPVENDTNDFLWVNEVTFQHGRE